MNKTFTKIALISMTAALPLVAFAATATVGSILTRIQDTLNVIIPILMILATVVFLWGVIMYVLAAGDADKVKMAKAYILWGLIALFAMVAVWGLVKALVTTFSVGGEVQPLQPGAFQ